MRDKQSRTPLFIKAVGMLTMAAGVLCGSGALKSAQAGTWAIVPYVYTMPATEKTRRWEGKFTYGIVKPINGPTRTGGYDWSLDLGSHSQETWGSAWQDVTGRERYVLRWTPKRLQNYQPDPNDTPDKGPKTLTILVTASAVGEAKSNQEYSTEYRDKDKEHAEASLGIGTLSVVATAADLYGQTIANTGQIRALFQFAVPQGIIKNLAGYFEFESPWVTLHSYAEVKGVVTRVS